MRTRTNYLRQLDQLSGHVRALSSGIVDDIRDTGFAIAEGNAEAAQEVIDAHHSSERLHRSIEDACLNIMLLQSPLASDLRFVTSTFRVVSDLARIDEMAYEIALLTKEADLASDDGIARNLGAMSQRAANMAEKASSAFDDSNVEQANAVFPMDDEVDKLFDTVRKKIVELLKSDSQPATFAPELLSVAKYYERMGDHAQSIANWAIFRATGEYRGRAMGEMS
ncbi:MAG: phosphate signaling complex protein PhoU [Atopobiaceae bacterium]|jgi:phosphate transport system protein